MWKSGVSEMEARMSALPGEIEIVPARLRALNDVLAILEEATAWLHGRGIVGQWPATFQRQWVADQIKRGEVYLALRDLQAIGTLRLQWSDRATWGNVPNDAGYVHGLAIRRAVAGQGVGVQMLRWAERAAAAAGRRYLRLDCWAENQELCRYYERAGFTSRGQIDVRGWKCALFELEIGSYAESETSTASKS
jgi:ribosomal protein S18 acetylase RimI-like enzyme